MEAFNECLTRGLLRRGQLPSRVGQPRWELSALFGRWVELSGSGCAKLSAVVQLLLKAQSMGAPVAWVRLPQQSFYPPDLAAWGVQLQAMAVVVAPDLRAAGRACEHLLRAGTFAVVVMDVVPRRRFSGATLPMAMQGRLVRLAQRRQVLLLSITSSERQQASLGTMVSLRAEVQGRFVSGPYATRDYIYRIEVFKDKIHGPGWHFEQKIRGCLAEQASA